MNFLALKPRGNMRWRICVIIWVTFFLGILAAPVALANPLPGSPGSQSTPSVADWLSDESRQQLQPGFNLLVPDVIPTPLSGKPAITSYDGFYQLYWVNPGVPPTFLSISGETGGEISAYSKADRNILLIQNADVAGYPAYHDLTAIYDLINWQVGYVVYSLESRNLDSTDSLALTNSLAQLNPVEQQQPADSLPTVSLPNPVNSGEVIEVSITGAEGTALSADAGFFVSTGESTAYDLSESSILWQAPDVSVKTDVLFVLAHSQTGDWLATANTRVFPGEKISERVLTCPNVAFSGESVEFSLSGTGYAVVGAGSGYFADAEANSLFAPNFAVETPGECDITVQAAGLDSDNAPSSDPSKDVNESTEENGTDSESEEPKESALLLQNDPEPTATKKPSNRPTKTPKPYSEVVGIPTTESEGQTVVAARGSPTAVKSPTARPTATFAPTLLDDGTVASVMGVDGGTLTSPQGVTLIVPPGALAGQSTITIQPVTDTKLPTGNGVQLVRNTAFDVTVAGADGRAIDKLLAPAEVRVQLDEALVEQGVRLYEVDGSTLRQLPDTVIEGDELVVSLTSFSRIVAGKPVPVTATAKRNVLPFILAAVVVMILLVVLTLLAGMFRPRRQRIITNRRPTRTRHR